MFSTKLKNICCNFAENKVFEDGGHDGRHVVKRVAIITVN